MYEVLKAFGFDLGLINWVLNLTSSTFFSIPLNGSPTTAFAPLRGIRQGDPLSSYVFILMAKILSRRIKYSLCENCFFGLLLHGLNPPPSHRQFVDDTHLMGIPYVREVNCIQAILIGFCEDYETSINKAKSHIFFFNTPLVIQRHIARILGFSRSVFTSNALAYP